ncbi:MAG: PEGA domain-containing protein, partial [Candidatus Marinimicrobia bacterium]|nr:PEGA domain-containing protein [Candidatus Neomarinimicrobiota bacterium]
MKYLLAILTIAIGLNQSVKPIVAVVDFENQTPNVSNSQLAMVRDQIEIALVQSAKYTMISPNDRDKVLKELKFQNTSGCVEQSCIIELGNALGAQMLVSGSLSQIGDIFILTAKMYSVETGKIYKSATYNKAKALQDVVLQGTISVVAQLTGKLQMISQYEPEIIEPQQNVGYLTVNTQPAGIDIKIDGQNTHLQTPMINFELSTGTHTVILTSDKYERVAQAVIIEPKKTKEIEIILVEKQGEVNFVTDPKGAEVFVDGAYKGTTPMQLTIKLSNYDIKLEKEFYKDISYKLTVDGDLVESYKKMGPKLVNVTLLTKPNNAKAKLTINGKSKGVVGENGMDLELLPNIYDIKLTADNFETEQTTITITPDNYFEKTFNLQKKKSVIRNSKDNNYNGKTGTMTDQDGNIYETVQIGDQCWMVGNLKV